MMLTSRNRKGSAAFGWLIIVLLLVSHPCRADRVTVVLKNGERVTGELLSLSTDSITLSNAVSGRIIVPVAQAARIERQPDEHPADKPATAEPAPDQVAGADAPAEPAPGAVQSTPAATKPKPPKRWNLDVQLGLDLQYNQKERQLYYTRAKWTYGKERFRGIVDYLANYGKTDGKVSANNMHGGVRLELDLARARKVFTFGAVGGSYDEIRKIDRSFDASSGIGYKLVNRTNWTLNADFGGNYQRQYFNDGTIRDRKTLRVGESLSWKINTKWILDQKAEYYARLTGIGDYRVRYESNLRYLVMPNITLNITAIDQYDTQPARNVSNNDLLLRATLGLKF